MPRPRVALTKRHDEAEVRLQQVVLGAARRPGRSSARSRGTPAPKLVGPDPGPRVLDVACGHGPVARELARRGADVIGVDITSGGNRARSWVIGASPDIEDVAGDATEPTLLEGEVFDLIVCNFGLSDIDDLDSEHA